MSEIKSVEQTDFLSRKMQKLRSKWSYLHLNHDMDVLAFCRVHSYFCYRYEHTYQNGVKAVFFKAYSHRPTNLSLEQWIHFETIKNTPENER